MDELGRALGELAREACAGVTAVSGSVVRRRARRRVVAHVAGGLAAGAVALGLVLSGWTAGGRDGGTVASVATSAPVPAGSSDREWPPLLGDWAGRAGAAVFLTDDVTDEQRAAIRALIETSDVVVSVEYESKQQAFERFKRQFVDNPDATDRVTPEAMPESFRIMLRAPGRFADLRQRLCPDASPGTAHLRGGGCMPGIELVDHSDLVVAQILGGRSWTGRADAAVVLSMDVTPAQRAAVRRQLEAGDNVTGVEYESAEGAVERLRRELPPPQLRLLGSGASAMPASFRVRLADPTRFPELRDAFCAQPRTANCAAGVLIVIDQRDVPASPRQG